MTNEQFQKSVNEDIKRLIQQGEKTNKAIPDSFEDWLKSNNDDIGGNEIPDRVQANHERYAQQGEKQSIPF